MHVGSSVFVSDSWGVEESQTYVTLLACKWLGITPQTKMSSYGMRDFIPGNHQTIITHSSQNTQAIQSRTEKQLRDSPQPYVFLETACCFHLPDLKFIMLAKICYAQVLRP